MAALITPEASEKIVEVDVVHFAVFAEYITFSQYNSSSWLTQGKCVELSISDRNNQLNLHKEDVFWT